ncbi:MAG: biotin synthase BioB [Zoogloeaceae bacterium]|jgi:biotin synthase|nr:biotin synthase BioB [Zoogloeaceae bacterium]
MSQAWTTARVLALFELPFMDLLHQAQTTHRAHFDPNAIQRSTLLSVKTGGCSEDCRYCSQSAHYDTAVQKERMLPLDTVLAAAQAAKDKGATRFCMGAAGRRPRKDEMPRIVEMIEGVKALGMETCVTLGMLSDEQADELKAAGLDYYNHNLDTDKDFYGNVIRTHTHEDRLDTLAAVRKAGLSICAGGIIGMGETREHRAGLIAELANLPKPPESVPINHLVPIPGTPFGEIPALDPFEFVRTIAAARIAMPQSWVRLSAGRQGMSDELQALCFLAGANSIFYGEKLLTTGLPETDRDEALFARLGLYPAPMQAKEAHAQIDIVEPVEAVAGM